MRPSTRSKAFDNFNKAVFSITSVKELKEAKNRIKNFKLDLGNVKITKNGNGGTNIIIKRTLNTGQGGRKTITKTLGYDNFGMFLGMKSDIN